GGQALGRRATGRRPRAAVRADRGDPPAEEPRHRDVRRDRRGAHAPGRQRPARRPAAPRHRHAPARHGAHGDRGRVRAGPEGGRGPRGGRRHRRSRGPRGPHPGGLHRLRHRHRDARHDGDRRAARPHPRPSGQDAEPAHGHRDDGGGARGPGGQGGQDRVPHGPHRDHPRAARQEVVRRAQAGRELRHGARRDHPQQARRGQGALPADDHDRLDDEPGDPSRPHAHPQPARGGGRPGRVL
ncbi:MAG: LSU ribosomal protein L1p (L10Ae), partial [uncultured Thermoleophilia bacterium]